MAWEVRIAGYPGSVRCNGWFAEVAVVSSLCRFRLFTRSGGALQEALGAEILIKVRPVNPVPGSGNPPVRPLFWGSMQQPRVPRKGNDYGSSVEEIDTDRVVSELDISDTFAAFRF
jgi:hypothetical protein